MSDYDFKALNDKEFEVLCTDLLSKRDGARYERFKPGKDGGVDGRFFKFNRDEVILQCKHWATSPLERLVQHLKSSEATKVSKLKPSKYILALSHSLSRIDKAKIAAIFSPYLTSPSDVLGREDLNDLLAEHPDIEQRHYKLWIQSSAVLVHLLNKAIHDRSNFALEEIKSTAHLYVPTQSHDSAIEKLENIGSVIITGAPGIGKTTLADHLTLHYVAKGFHLVCIGDEISEAESIYDSTIEQVFYFDDFLGRNYLEALSGHEGTQITRFIKRILKDRKKRFILTSRTTILNQGKLLNDVFQNNSLDRNEFEVTLNSFSEMDRARILYNHIWHSNLSAEYIDAIYEKKRYKDIIRHRNYNPRLIQFITDSERLTNCEATKYWAHANDLLENPAKVWENPFEAQIDDFGRALVLLVTLNRRPILQSDLSESFVRYTTHPDIGNLHGRRDYLATLKHLSGSLLSRTIVKNDAVMLNLFNPSIGDFVLHRYVADFPSLRAGFSSLRSQSSLRTLTDLAANRMIGNQDAAGIFRYLLSTAYQLNYVGYSVEYIALAMCQLKLVSPKVNTADYLIKSCIDFVLNSDCPTFFADVAEIVSWALANGQASHTVAAEFVETSCRMQPNAQELDRLGVICRNLSPEHFNSVLSKFKGAAISYLIENVRDEFPDSDVFDRLGPNDTSEAEENLRELVEKKSIELGVDIDEEEMEQLIEAFDIQESSDNYFDTGHYDSHSSDSSANEFHIDEIDDLFERT